MVLLHILVIFHYFTAECGSEVVMGHIQIALWVSGSSGGISVILIVSL